MADPPLADGEGPLNDQEHSWAEELANVATHGLGSVLSLLALVVLVVDASHRPGPVRLAAAAVYGGALVTVYVSSTLYHSTRHPPRRLRYKIWDHAAIFLLIAGTYTPYGALVLRDEGGWLLLAAVWGLALGGVVFKFLYADRYEVVSILWYLGMGWMGIVMAGPIVERLHPDGVFWLLAGGLAYTAGVAFYLWERLPFNHAVWHVFVMAGSACHFVSIFWYVVPGPANGPL